MEAAGWVLTTADVHTAVAADTEAFLRMLEHPHWLGIVLRAVRARVVRDSGGATERLVARCQAALHGEPFLSLWRKTAQQAQRDGLDGSDRR